MEDYLIVIADHSRADVLRMSGWRSAARTLASLTNPAGHAHERDLGTARPGRVVAGRGPRRHAFSPRHTLRAHATEVFAQRVAREAARRLGAPHTSLILAAAPALQGVLQRHLQRATQRDVHTLPGNLTKLAPRVVQTRLARYVLELSSARPFEQRNAPR